ncbi:MAG: hypothetical protein ACTSSQ_05300 [Alphaproteobacteria bacterium]
MEIDLDSAVERGIVSAEQAARLAELGRDEGTQSLAPDAEQLADGEFDRDDEGFRFIAGFADIFLAIGVVMLLYGFSASNLTATMGGHLATIAVIWGLSEILATRLRRALPSMILAVALVFQAVSLCAVYVLGNRISDPLFLRQWSDVNIPILWLSLAALLAAVIHFWRFRLPFSLALIGIAIASLVVSLSYIVLGGDMVSYIVPILFLTGLAFFAAAMRFDMADIQRTSRLSDNAFWLHIIASPLIVHSLMWQSAIWLGAGDPKLWFSRQPGESFAFPEILSTLAIVVLLIFAVLIVVALVIDRRAMLVSSLIYVSLAVSYYVTQQGAAAGAVTYTPIIIGIGIIAVGIGWRPMRRFLFSVLPLASIAPYVPPTAYPHPNSRI